MVFIILFGVWYIWRNKHDDFMEQDPTVVRLKNILKPYFPELNDVKLMKGPSSYTINKYRVYLCTEYDGVTYTDNMLVYVILHELAHVITPDIGHGETFMVNFNKLLQRAVDYGLYDPTISPVKDYCNSN